MVVQLVLLGGEGAEEAPEGARVGRVAADDVRVVFGGSREVGLPAVRVVQLGQPHKVVVVLCVQDHDLLVAEDRPQVLRLLRVQLSQLHPSLNIVGVFLEVLV